MKHLRHRNIKILSELMNYLLKVGCDNIDIHFNVNEEDTEITIKCLNKNISADIISELNRFLSVPRRRDMEEYYWGLNGDDDLDTELFLVGMMTDDVNISYTDNLNLEIKLLRLNK